MESALFFKEYFLWHYGKALQEIYELLKNFFWFGYHFFSFKLLLKTLFSPFFRLKEKTKKGIFDIETFFGNLIVNTIMRLVGFSFRVVVILIGLIFELFMLIVSAAAFVIWIFLPIIFILLLFIGVPSLFL